MFLTKNNLGKAKCVNSFIADVSTDRRCVLRLGEVFFLSVLWSYQARLMSVLSIIATVSDMSKAASTLPRRNLKTLFNFYGSPNLPST